MYIKHVSTIQNNGKHTHTLSLSLLLVAFKVMGMKRLIYSHPFTYMREACGFPSNVLCLGMLHLQS